MKKILLALLIYMGLVSVALAQYDDYGEYGEEGDEDAPEWKQINIVSCMVKYKITVKDENKGESIVFYDEWGQYESKESNAKTKTRSGNEIEINQFSITTPDSFYIFFPKLGVGMKNKAPDRTELIDKFALAEGNFDKVQTKGMQEAGFKKTGKEMVLNKNCNVWEATIKGNNIKMYLYKGVELKVVSETPQGLVIQEAIEFIESDVPWSKFEPMNGVKWMDGPALQQELGKHFK